jgi:hypothetical protein
VADHVFRPGFGRGRVEKTQPGRQLRLFLACLP